MLSKIIVTVLLMVMKMIIFLLLFFYDKDLYSISSFSVTFLSSYFHDAQRAWSLA